MDNVNDTVLAEQEAEETGGRIAAAPAESLMDSEGEASPEAREEKPVMSPEERARQAAGRRLRQRAEAARSAARAEIEETLRRRGVVDPRTGRPLESLEALEREEEPPERRSPTQDPRVTAELEEIRRMDPEMEDLGCILRSENGESFRRYVRRGLSFVEAYTLAARNRLEARSRERARIQAASKDHLSATDSRGDGGLSVPGDELMLFRELLPEAGDAEIRRYYNADRKRFGK